MPRQPIVQPDGADEARARDAALRPRWLKEVIGQKAVVQRLGIVLNACRKLKEALPHILFDGPPGLGKTTFATVLPTEMGRAAGHLRSEEHTSELQSLRHIVCLSDCDTAVCSSDLT